MNQGVAEQRELHFRKLLREGGRQQLEAVSGAAPGNFLMRRAS